MTQCIEHNQSRSNGYGTTTHAGKGVYLHRLAYCKANSVTLESISGMSVRHTCDNVRCINPEHLLLGSHTDNMQDKVARGRTGSKLTDHDVTEMRRAYGPGCTLAMLASRYETNQATVSRIINRKAWTHLA